MSRLRILYHLVRADFLERVRRYSFGAMLLFTIFLTYLFIPAIDAPAYVLLVLGGYRPVYNSAWIGSMTTLLMAEFFLLFAFYLLKGNIERDRATGVGQIIATTPISRPMYMLGKWLSNVAVATAMVAAIIVAAGALQFIRAEDLQLDLWALASPFVIVLLPGLAVIAAVAVLFESVNALRGGLGNVLFFFVAYPILVLSIDLQGINIIYPSIYQACAEYFPHCNPGRQIDLYGLPISSWPTFRYEGVPWTADLVLQRLILVALGAAIALLAAVFFHRFDPARSETSLFGHAFERLKGAILAFVVQPPEADESEDDPAVKSVQAVHLTPLPQAHGSSALHLYARMVMAEIRLVFKGVRWWWYLVAVALLGVSVFVPLDLAHLIVLPLAWIWPLMLWSAMGAREVSHHVEPIVFAVPFPLRRQLPVSWLVGVLIALLMGIGIIVRLALAGQGVAMLAVIVGVLFVPSLALAMGCWSGGSKLFEATYLFFWYMAAVQSVPQLDFMGRFPQTISGGLTWFYAGLTVLLLGVALLGRQRQLRQ